MISYHPAKYDGHEYCGSGDIIVCHVILQDLMIKGPCDFIGESPSW